MTYFDCSLYYQLINTWCDAWICLLLVHRSHQQFFLFSYILAHPFLPNWKAHFWACRACRSRRRSAWHKKRAECFSKYSRSIKHLFTVKSSRHWGQSRWEVASETECLQLLYIADSVLHTSSVQWVFCQQSFQDFLFFSVKFFFQTLWVLEVFFGGVVQSENVSKLINCINAGLCKSVVQKKNCLYL